MNERIRISKKNVYIVGFLILFLFLFVLLSQLALRSNQANNSRASETNNTIQLIPTSPAPSLNQLSEAKSYKAARDMTGDIELFGTPPQIIERKMYSIYMNKNSNLIYIDTFIATTKSVYEKFSTFWKPKNPVSIDDVQNSTFFLFKVN